MISVTRYTTCSPRRGMTLTEILIAMLVLLVGIYTVARGFPLMLQSIRGEGDRTTMARLAEEKMSRLADDQGGMPEAITGTPDISADSSAEDMTEPHATRNAQEDMIEVRGETFRVPAPYRAVGSTYVDAPGWYALSQGPAGCEDFADDLAYPCVYMLVPLQERLDDPRATGAVDIDEGNWFYVDRTNGQVVVPATVTAGETAGSDTWNSDGVLVDYAWTTQPTGGTPYAIPTVHYVQGETPGDVDAFDVSGTAANPDFQVCTLYPAHNSGGAVDGTACRLLAGQTRAWARVNFHRMPFGDTFPTDKQWYILENKYGATLGFHPAAAGLTLKVDYQLRTTKGASDTYARRLLLMQEDRVIQPTPNRVDGSGVSFGDLRLALKHLDDEAVFTKDLQGNDLASPVHVLAVDLRTGECHTDGAPLVLNDLNLEPPLQDGYQNGLLSLPLQVTASGSPVAADYLGHVWRFYYRTLERHNVQVQKAPRAYVDDVTAQRYLAAYLPSDQQATAAAVLADVNYRTYRPITSATPGASDDSQICTLQFGQWLDDGTTFSQALNTSGFTVAVDYAYWQDTGAASPVRRLAWGELHTISPEGTRTVLNHTTYDLDHPFEIIAVNGVSARARCWWLTRTGVQRKLDVETVFLASALGLLPVVR